MRKPVKRFIDICASALGILALAIPFLLVAIVIKLDSPGPVLFISDRVGYQGRIIRPWKLRSMVHDEAQKGSGHAASLDDPRITRVGKFLRTWSIDELPQLMNVLCGEMSLVGPRPWVPGILRSALSQTSRARMRPGITGLAAIRGRNTLSWDERLAIDTWYIDHWSLWLDLRILLSTPLKILSREGLYGAGGMNPSINERLPISSGEGLGVVDEADGHEFHHGNVPRG
jgi:lipopolysaccharide/colanic/teichoic acid biosynthesis glycosyltransferase